MLFMSNLLIGDLPDALGLLAFGLVMVVTSMMLRRLIGEDTLGDQSENAIEEIV